MPRSRRLASLDHDHHARDIHLGAKEPERRHTRCITGLTDPQKMRVVTGQGILPKALIVPPWAWGGYRGGITK